MSRYPHRPRRAAFGEEPSSLSSWRRGVWPPRVWRQQWIIQRRKGKPRPTDSKGSGVAEPDWRGVSFVGGKKATLGRLFREKGIVLTPEAQTRFDVLPEQFMDFIAAPERFTAQWLEAA